MYTRLTPSVYLKQEAKKPERERERERQSRSPRKVKAIERQLNVWYLGLGVFASVSGLLFLLCLMVVRCHVLSDGLFLS